MEIFGCNASVAGKLYAMVSCMCVCVCVCVCLSFPFILATVPPIKARRALHFAAYSMQRTLSTHFAASFSVLEVEKPNRGTHAGGGEHFVAFFLSLIFLNAPAPPALLAFTFLSQEGFSRRFPSPTTTCRICLQVLASVHRCFTE